MCLLTAAYQEALQINSIIPARLNKESDRHSNQQDEQSRQHWAGAAHLGLSASDRAAHDETVAPYPSVPLGSYPLDLYILKACLSEPLHHNKLVQPFSVQQ